MTKIGIKIDKRLKCYKFHKINELNQMWQKNIKDQIKVLQMNKIKDFKCNFTFYFRFKSMVVSMVV
jgi:hypothetical protein